MKNIHIPILLVLGLSMVFHSCKHSSTTSIADHESEQSDLKWNQMADLLMERMDLQQGERVLLVGSPGRFEPLYEHLVSALQESNCEFLGFISSGSDMDGKWSTPFTNAYEEMTGTERVENLKQVDLGVMLPGAQASPIYAQIQSNLNNNIGRTIHFHWAGAYDLSMNELNMNSEIDQIYQKSLLETDYKQLAIDQQRFAEAIRNQPIQVTTPAGTNITFSIGNRPITLQNGDASFKKQNSSRNLIDREIELPAGAVRVAPMEESVNGVVVFPDAEWAGSPVKDLKLTFVKGKVTNIEASSGQEAARREIESTGETGKTFREFVLGMNPTLAVTDGNEWFPYYGYGAGVVRLSLGNNLELGGEVSGNYVRWNLFTDATVVVGDDVWVSDGKLIQ